MAKQFLGFLRLMGIMKITKEELMESMKMNKRELTGAGS
jgi:hypothetical protein